MSFTCKTNSLDRTDTKLILLSKLGLLVKSVMKLVQLLEVCTTINDEYMAID